MVLKALAIIAGGLFLVYVGFRSAGGYEAEAEHLYGGQFETITCEDGRAIAGKGMFALSAQRACEEKQADQRKQAPWWMLAGGGVTAFGISRYRKARAG